MASPIIFANQNNTTNTDTWINNSIYRGMGSSEGIDLRLEVRAILYGDSIKTPKGHWIAYRNYSNKESDSWSSITKEGVEGPAYEYTDITLRTRRVPVAKAREQLHVLKSGLDIGDSFVYYFDYTVIPKLGDDIFELSLVDHSPKSININNYKYIEKYKIQRKHPYRLDNGNIQYWLVVAQYDEISY